jgi:hypothetical protein
VATSLDTRNDELGRPSDRTYQSFADDFINRGVEREVPSATGVGNRGVSTSLVASMTVPVDDLADIVSARLLAEAVDEMSVPTPGRGELNRPLIERCFAYSDLDPLRSRTALPFTEPAAPKGPDRIVAALGTRARTMEANLAVIEQRVAEQVATLATRFDPDRAVEQMLRAETSLFHLRRVMLGDSRLAEPIDRQGFVGVLEERRSEPKAPAGITMAAPLPGQIRNRFFGLRRARWTDPQVQQVLQLQNAWYQWRTQRAWSLVWNDQTPRWERKVRKLRRDLHAVTDAFIEHAQLNPARWTARVRDLYRPRVGVSYLLPPQGSDLEVFYRSALRCIVKFRGEQHKLKPNSSAAQIVTALIGPDVWWRAYELGAQRGAEHAVSLVRDILKQTVKHVFRLQEPGEQALLPGLADLLAAAAGKAQVAIGDEDLTQFRQKIASLVPGGFSPQGHGRMKVLISYAAAARDADIEGYLNQQIYLQRTPDTVVEFRPVNTESITVVFFRTSMAVTEVPELREVLRTWSGAVHAGESQDFLKWRQRLGYDFGYLMTTEEHRVRILHRFLCALWNGQVDVNAGDHTSPESIHVRLGVDHAVSMQLKLDRFAKASSWANLIRAYEEWTITDDQQIRREFCEQLMNTLPVGLESAPPGPSDLYVRVRWMAADEMLLLEELLPRLPEGSTYARLLRTIWAETLPAALDLPFEGVNHPVAHTLRKLEEVVDL